MYQFSSNASNWSFRLHIKFVELRDLSPAAMLQTQADINLQSNYSSRNCFLSISSINLMEKQTANLIELNWVVITV